MGMLCAGPTVVGKAPYSPQISMRPHRLGCLDLNDAFPRLQSLCLLMAHANNARV